MIHQIGDEVFLYLKGAVAIAQEQKETWEFPGTDYFGERLLGLQSRPFQLTSFTQVDDRDDARAKLLDYAAMVSTGGTYNLIKDDLTFSDPATIALFEVDPVGVEVYADVTGPDVDRSKLYMLRCRWRVQLVYDDVPIA